MDDTTREDEAVIDESGADAVEMRPCKFCGAETHPSAYRCSTCGGHVGLAWGTVHKEQFLFLFSTVFIAVACLVSWDTERKGDLLMGYETVRGAMMLGLAVYGVFVAVFNILHRRMVVWPFFLNALVALWTGLEVVISAVGSDRWKALKDATGSKWLDPLKAIPPGMFMLTAAGGLVMIALLKGVIGGFMGGAAKAKAGKSQAAERRSSRRRDRGPGIGGEGVGGAGPDATLPPEGPGPTPTV